MLKWTLLSCHKELLFCILGIREGMFCVWFRQYCFGSHKEIKDILMVVHNFEFLSWGLECSFIYLELYRACMRLFEFAATLSMEKHNFSPVWNKWWQHVIFFFAALTIIFFLSSNSYSDKNFSISLVTVLLLAWNCCMAKHRNCLERYSSQVVFHMK